MLLPKQIIYGNLHVMLSLYSCTFIFLFHFLLVFEGVYEL